MHLRPATVALRQFSRLRFLATASPRILRSQPVVNAFQTSAFRFSPSTVRTMASAAAQRLAGKTILITGASAGIGRSAALEFARTSPKDLRLILTARREDTLKEVAADIQKEVGDGVKVLTVKLDISKPDEVRSFVGNLSEEWRDIHILLNNA